MGQKIIISNWSLIIALCLIGCQSNSESTFKNAAENQVEEKKYPFEVLEDTTDCLLLLEMLKKECVALNSRLNVPTLEQVVILVPASKYDLDCDQFNLDNIPVFVNQEVISLDSIKNYKSQKDDPVRIFYLLDYKSRKGFKSIELMYTPSGSIFKIVVKIDEGKGIIDDFFCAKF